MGVKEKYNSIIDMIENGIIDRERYPEKDDLALAVSTDNGISVREMTTIFKFFTGNTLKSYVTDRRLMAAYKYLIENEKPSIFKAVEISWYDNQQSFNKAFSNRFGIAPRKASEIKDQSLLEEPLTFEQLEGKIAPTFTEDKEVDTEKKIFGLTAEQYERVMEAADLTVFYDFSPMFSRVAFELSEEWNMPLKRTFAYVDSLRDFGGDFIDDDDDNEYEVLEPEELLNYWAHDNIAKFMFFEVGISVDSGIILYDYLGMKEEVVLAEDPKLLKMFSGLEDISYDYLKEVYRYYLENTDGKYYGEDYERYIDLICSGISKEWALENIFPTGELDEYITKTSYNVDLQYEAELINDAYEHMAEEEEAWHGIRIDEEYDEDSFWYDDGEDDDPFGE